MSIERTAMGANRRVTLRLADHTPANKRKGEVKAHAELQATVNIARGWLELHATEFVEAPGTLTGFRRNRVWLTFEEDQARALYMLLRERFGA